MTNHTIPVDIDDYLFGGGMTLYNYFVRVTPFSETVCYVNGLGQEFYLSISSDELEEKISRRLTELGVRRINVV